MKDRKFGILGFLSAKLTWGLCITSCPSYSQVILDNLLRASAYLFGAYFPQRLGYDLLNTQDTWPLGEHPHSHTWGNPMHNGVLPRGYIPRCLVYTCVEPWHMSVKVLLTVCHPRHFFCRRISTCACLWKG